jgi:hypothetical protein
MVALVGAGGNFRETEARRDGLGLGARLVGGGNGEGEAAAALIAATASVPRSMSRRLKRCAMMSPNVSFADAFVPISSGR